MGVSGGTTQEEKGGGERVEEESECFRLETKRRQGGHSDSALLREAPQRGGGGQACTPAPVSHPPQLQVGTGLTLPLQTPVHCGAQQPLPKAAITCLYWGPPRTAHPGPTPTPASVSLALTLQPPAPTFLADRASLLAGGGDMRLVSSGAVALPRPRPLGLLVLESTLEPGLKSDP